ncbi:PQQ-dependent sugar dehydrogenase [Ornithinimicrobium murale]|uniref:PQQ-dependent sugar dehydrogenase n=1 Tax=Ornithinimicrobium murale TaxID=1050153 RepID=UPI000E0CD58C|nr:PQQ-dependent sugar dehydrogenase [Ornithinimicrobium murale]
MRAHPAAAFTLAALVLAGCSEDRQPAGVSTADDATDDAGTDAGTDVANAGTATDVPTEATPGEDATTTTPSEVPDPVLTLATGFEVPWGLVPLDDGSLLVGERDTATVFHVVPGSDPEALTTVPDVAPEGEGGLLGLAVPADSSWHTGTPGAFYAYATTATDNRVLRVTPGDGEPTVETVLDGIPKAGNHNGGRIAFGPDDHLYITTGDASDGASAQDPASLAGKILRITPDGEPAPGNPDPSSPVLSLGHRNVQGLDWDDSGRLWASEFGQNALDEVNLIEPGGNYGWPQVEGPGGEPEFIDPVVSWPTEDSSPSGLAVGSDGDLYVAALRGEGLWRVPLGDGTGESRGDDAADAAGEVAVGEPERLLQGQFGRLRSVVTGPGGELWVLTSNTFRGDPTDDDDRLLLIEDPAVLDSSTQVAPAG